MAKQKDTIVSVPKALTFYTPKKEEEGDYQVSAESIIFGSYVKMDRLRDIVYDTFGNTSIANATHINVFIDLYSVMHQIFSRKNRTIINNISSITPSIINMCAHYRTFFRGLGVHTTFYLIYSNNTCDINEKFVYGYNKTFKEKSNIKLFKNITNDNFELLKILCPYLPDIFFIKSVRGYESSVIIADIIEKRCIGQPNLIISKDLYPIQLCYQYPCTSFLYPRKNRYSNDNKDISVMVPIFEDKEKFRVRFWNLISEKRKVSAKNLYRISPMNYIIYSAMSGFIEREIYPLVKRSTEAIKIIESIAGSSDIQVFPSQLFGTEAELSVQVTLLQSVCNALDVQYMLPFYREDIECKEMKFENLEDNGTINMINSKYFNKNPIDTLRL